jgi:hypothetical protein
MSQEDKGAVVDSALWQIEHGVPRAQVEGYLRQLGFSPAGL